jgi:hypothetical protein
MDKKETIALFFSKISQLKEQLLVVGALTEEDDFIGAVIDELPNSWAPFISFVCGRGQSPSFERFWHDCIEEQNRLQRRFGSSSKAREKDLVLSAKFKKGKKFKGKKPQKDSNLSHIWCFRCDQLGHYAKDCKKFPPQGKRGGRPKRKKFHAFVVVEEGEEEQRPQKRMTRVVTREEKKECFLVSALSGSITDAEHIWLIDSGASRHMIGFKDSISNAKKKIFHTKVELGDNGTYAIEGIGSTSLKLDSGWSLHLEEIMYVPGLKKNLLSVGVLEEKGYIVAFTQGKAIMWPSDGDMSSAIEIGVKVLKSDQLPESFSGEDTWSGAKINLPVWC